MAKITLFKSNGEKLWNMEDTSSALDFIPPIGSTINYQEFTEGRQNKNFKIGELKKYVVESIEFFTEEGWNGVYMNKQVKVFVRELL